MGALQPGLPSPTMIPANWPIIVMDLKDCFFTIPLVAQDCPRFAFSVPSINNSEPMQRYHWTVLPQGMKNSPTICQIYVARALSGVREQYPQILIYHYMDDILIAGASVDNLQLVVKDTVQALQKFGLQVAPEKVQKELPWHYLGWKIMEHAVEPQRVALKWEVSTLNDVQRILGAINWVRPLLGITNDTLQPLFDLLRGDPALDSKRILTPEAKEALAHIEQAIQSRQAHCVHDGYGLQLYIINAITQPLALLGQWVATNNDPLLLIEWVFLPYQPVKTITTRGGNEVQLRGEEVHTIYIPLTKEHLDWSLANSIPLQTALLGYGGTLSIHMPAHKLFMAFKDIEIVARPRCSPVPVSGITVFTNGSGKTGRAVIVWKEEEHWKEEIHVVQGTPQIVELVAVIKAFQRWSEPLNIVTDSQYVCGVVQRLEKAWLKHVNNEQLFSLFKQLWYELNRRQNDFYVLHTRSHTNLPGFIVEGNRRADRLTAPVWATPVPQTIKQAQLSHEFFHQSAKALRKQFGLSWDTARAIVRACPDCQPFAAVRQTGVNPRGLYALQLWQTDVTHIAEFGRQKWVHVSIDTYSGALRATAESGEKAKDVIRHWTAAFAALGVPSTIKTDNGPGYISQKTQRFLQLWGVVHVTGIPHSPQGQAIVERSHQTLKHMLEKQKGGMVGESPQVRLWKTVYTLNYLDIREAAVEQRPPIVRHFLSFGSTDRIDVSSKDVKVWVRSLQSGQWEGPYTLITWGRGYACVSTEQGPRWIPARCVRPALEKANHEDTDKPAVANDMGTADADDRNSSEPHVNDSLEQ
ncbi:hypothetical protein QYF61_007320 [Mycteria americana]|uniref:Uncharacterized protein n=1 Tax=Mycteria americana TaxID=33587 RepID=A0AAN7MJ82_MYCAM|nr:hypothetical protein QYF61_007320 [Mycteria americana]